MRTVDPERWFRSKAARMRRAMGPAEHSLEMRLRRSFREAMTEYWRHSSLQGINKLFRADLSNFERRRNAAVFVLSCGVTVSVLAASSVSQASAPALQLNLLPAQHSIRDIPFPAVALCSTNAITRKALDDYTMFLYSRDENNTYHAAQIRHNLLTFGALLTRAAPPADLMFMRFLARVESGFNVTRLMYKLSPSCSELLIRCSWRGRVVSCEKLFASRVTPLGFCCVFNSRYYTEDRHRLPKYSDMIGEDFGLSVIVQENPDNFAFMRRPNIGLEVLLFEGGDYPLMEGGGVHTYPVVPNSSVSMTVRALVQRPASGACGASSGRGYVRCLTRCRRRTLAALCGCRLHTLPPDAADADADPLCSLAHLDCLNKHREKLIYYYPHGHSEPSLDEELQNGQDCSRCTPDCTRHLYSATVSTYTYSHLYRDKIFKNVFTRNRTIINSTTIRLFFASDHQNMYRVEVDMRWFEILVKMSGEWWVVSGVALGCGSELLYHCTVRWRHHYRRRTALLTQYDY